jgi:hypothetical protein
METIEQEWRYFAQEALPDYDPDDDALEPVRRVFFAGAFAALSQVAEGNDNDQTSRDMQLIVLMTECNNALGANNG